MKKVLLIALVVVLIVIGLPVLMPGMAALHCEDCALTTAAGAYCTFVVLVGLAYGGALMSQRLRVRLAVLTDLWRAPVFDRPPQLA